MLKRFRKVKTPPPAGTAIVGVSNSVLPTVVGSGANASLGAVSGLVVEVTHGDSAPVATVVHPAGSAGATTPSKFSENVTGQGEDVGLAEGATVAVAVAVAVAVFVAVAVAVAVAVFVAVGVGLAVAVDVAVGVGEGVGVTPVMVMTPLV